MTEPMTAAEYRGVCSNGVGVFDPKRVLAALEERERLLGEREALTPNGYITPEALENLARCFADRAPTAVGLWRAAMTIRELEADARVGALVRRIREHPMGHRNTSIAVTEETYVRTLAYLDSLLPKEPEVAPSGWRYERDGDRVFQIDHVGRRTPIDDGPTDEMVPPCDAPVVAKLMAGGGK